MALAASLLRSEMRRHLMMNLGLVATCVVGGTVVTNERGLFVPINFAGLSDTAKAFSVMFTPSHLLPPMNNVAMAAPLEPFDVTGDSRDLRRRLMDAFNQFTAPASDYNDQVAQLGQPLSPTEYAANDGGGVTTPVDGAPATGGGTPGGDDAVSGPGASPFNPVGPIGPTTPIDGVNPTPPPSAPVPEPSMWAMMIAGFGAVGYMLRSARRRRAEAGAPAIL